MGKKIKYTTERKLRKRKQVIYEDNDDYFKIEDYTITDLPSFIYLIDNLISKPYPPKKIYRKLPKKIYKLCNIIDDLNDLNNLIGLTSLKQQLVDQLIYFTQDYKEEIMLHTVIEGPPGTGKTSVANIMARIYSGVGILKKNKCTIVKREDLIGQYLGETTIKTTEALDECLNGVMLIDEAYSLGSDKSDSQGDSYAKECIDTINQYLSENADKLICIIAGYKRELDTCFFALNPGLRRRFPWTFTIDSFKPNELGEILLSKIEDSNWETDITLDEISQLIKNKEQYFTGNGGDIDNILSKAKILYSRINFGKENLYMLNKDIIINTINNFISNKQLTTDKPPSMMYI